MRKYMLMLVLILASTLFIVACSDETNNDDNNNSNNSADSAENLENADSNSDNNSNSSEDGEVVELEYWYTKGGKYKELTEELVATFEEEHPNIKMNATFFTGKNYVAALQTGIASKMLPDFFLQHPSVPLSVLVEQGVIRDLSDYFTQEELDDWRPGSWQEGTTHIDGKLYSFHMNDQRIHAPALFYNKEMVANAGIEELPHRMSWEEFIEIAQKVKVANGLDAAVTSSGGGWPLGSSVIPMVTSVTPEASFVNPPIFIFNYKTGLPEYNTGLVDVFEFIKRLQDEELLHPDTMLFNPSEARATFWDNAVAFLFEPTSNVQVHPRDDDNFGVVHVPSFEGKPFYKGDQGKLGDNTPVVNSDTEHWEEVKIWLDFYLKHHERLIVKYAVGSPARMSSKEAFSSDWELYNDTQKINEETWKLVPRPANKNPNIVEVEKEFSSRAPTIDESEILGGYMTGQIDDVQAALDDYNQQMVDIFLESIKIVQDKGMEVEQSDFMFDDWDPTEPYVE